MISLKLTRYSFLKIFKAEGMINGVYKFYPSATGFYKRNVCWFAVIDEYENAECHLLVIVTYKIWKS